MQWCLFFSFFVKLYVIMGPLALCRMMNYLSIMPVTAPLMGFSFYLHPHHLLLLYLLYPRFICMLICFAIYWDDFLNVPLHFCVFTCQMCLLCSHSLSSFVSPCPCRDLSAHQGQTNGERACRHLLSTLLPLCRSFQWGARGVPHDATRFRNRRHRPIGPHR